MNRPIAFSVAALSAATLLLESTLTRLLAVAQFYHFAFLVVSLALLGFGASGTLLSIFPRLRKTPPLLLLALCGIAFSISTLLAYEAVNNLPFDTYSIAWDRRQILYFALYYLSLTLPFLWAGLGIAVSLASEGENSHIIYAANLFGSAIGVLLTPLALYLSGVPGAVLISCMVGSLPILPLKNTRLRLPALATLMVGLIIMVLLSKNNLGGQAILGMTISPYKGLSYAHQYPGSITQFSQWNTFSYVEVLSNAGTRILPGLSYMTPDISLPVQYGLSIDADSLLPITQAKPDQFTMAGYLPEAVAFLLRPEADVLVLDAGAGLGVLQALYGGARQVTTTVDNPLVLQAILQSPIDIDVFSDPRVQVISEVSRVYLQQDHHDYDLIYLPLTDAYRPITSGAYSLVEDYSLTEEAFIDILSHLNPDGILVISRWLQTPPSESIRLITMIDKAFEKSSLNHAKSFTLFSKALIAYRGIQTFTVIVQPDGWNNSELTSVREFTEERRFDLVWAPDIHPEETNQFNILTEPIDYELIQALLSTPNRVDFYDSYPYAIAPPTDDHPFFFHFFRWRQLPDVLANLGHKWQPFGGSGYLVLFAFLTLVVLLSSALIFLPLFFYRTGVKISKSGKVQAFAYFSSIGVAYLFIEIPLIQRSILLLGQPTYAFVVVVFTLLLFSSLGSLLARKIWLPKRFILPALVLFAALTPSISNRFGEALLGCSLLARVLITIISLIPLAVFMGFPFPFGLSWLDEHYPTLIPWAWAVNGCASVIASVVAAILALSYGFTFVLHVGAVIYGCAAVFYVWMDGYLRSLARKRHEHNPTQVSSF
jgi:hypothetical protein